VFSKLVFLLFFLGSTILVFGQKGLNLPVESILDTIPKEKLRGNLYPWRSNIDVLHYTIDLSVQPHRQWIGGSCKISFLVKKPTSILQWEADSALEIQAINWAKATEYSFKIKRIPGFIFLLFDKPLPSGKQNLAFKYAGYPRKAKKAPWDGGFVWQTDSLGYPWVGLAVEGEGANLWYPCKDHLSDKATYFVACKVPKPLKFIGNGNLAKEESSADSTSYSWNVTYPAPTYSISLNIGNYCQLKNEMEGKKGTLKLDYYVLKQDSLKAVNYFNAEVKPMIVAIEKRIAPYPFYNDGYALIQTPYWGMEHQSGIAYGNKFKKNSVGMDFIIVHESAHEWWGNSLSCSDHALMFIQEGYCTYSEIMYLEEVKGKAEVNEWLQHHKNLILNRQPMLGPQKVNYLDNDTDIYYKYALMLHTLRAMVGEKKFNNYWKSFYSDFKNKSVTLDQFNNVNEKYLGKSYQKLIKYYITHTAYPSLQVFYGKGKLYFRWNRLNFSGIHLPVTLNNTPITISPKATWQSIAYPKKVKMNSIAINPYLLIEINELHSLLK